MSLPTEHAEQVALVEWFRLQFPHLLLLAIPNGGGRSKAEAGRLKAEGVLAGAPDLFFPELRLWIEMKRSKGGRVSEAQTTVIAQLRAAGYNVEVCKGFEAARQVVWQAAKTQDKRRRE